MADPRFSLRDYLPARHAELIRRVDELYDTLAVFEGELDEINRAAKAAGIELADLSIQDIMPHTRPSEPKASNTSDKTMKEAAVEILEHAPGGLTANEILDMMSIMYGMNYPRSSLSPQLSRLKYDDVVGRHEGRWVLRKFLPGFARNENGTPKGAPEASDAGERKSP